MTRKASFALSMLIVLGIVALHAQQPNDPATEDNNVSDRVIKITMTDQGFEPNVLRLDGEPGQKLILKIQNRSKSEHGLRIKIGTNEYGPEHPIAPRQTVVYEMTMPKQGGLGSFYSPVGEDRARGFSGRAIIGGEAPGGIA